jgi:hypothetical protein
MNPYAWLGWSSVKPIGSLKSITQFWARAAVVDKSVNIAKAAREKSRFKLYSLIRPLGISQIEAICTPRWTPRWTPRMQPP